VHVGTHHRETEVDAEFFEWLESVHVIAITLVVGSVMIVDLRVVAEIIR
jgi:hypothetical protein